MAAAVAEAFAGEETLTEVVAFLVSDGDEVGVLTEVGFFRKAGEEDDIELVCLAAWRAALREAVRASGPESSWRAAAMIRSFARSTLLGCFEGVLGP